MKQYFSVFTHQHIALKIFLFFTMLSLNLPIASTAGNETNIGDELISLTVKNEPLGDVFKKVSMATGYEISLDNKWQSYRVTASLEEVSLHKGLKQILRNLNNVIIYSSSKKIKIIIYDKTEPEGVSSAPSTGKLFDGTSYSRRRSHHPPVTQLPFPFSQVLEKEDGSENEEEPSYKPDVSGQESETSAPVIEGEEKTKSKKPKIEANEGANTYSKEKSSEESSEQDNQTESKSGGETENSKSAENIDNTQ